MRASVLFIAASTDGDEASPITRKASNLRPNDAETLVKRGYAYSLMFKYSQRDRRLRSGFEDKSNDGDTRERLTIRRRNLLHCVHCRSAGRDPTPVPKPFRMPRPFWAVIGALALIVIILIATLIVRRKRAVTSLVEAKAWGSCAKKF
jgi:hypothetical protein